LGAIRAVILKIITLFLVFMAVLAMFGKLSAKGITKGVGKALGIKKPKRCDKCGSFLIGKGPCACERKS